MGFITQSIPEVVLIEPIVHGDERGYFLETFRQDLFEAAIGHKINFVQDNESRSTKGVLRGLHFQIPPFAQAKLVRVIQGSVLDVAVDIRKNSQTFGQHVSVILSSEEKNQLYIPRGFAHGFVTLSDTAIFAYKTDNYFSPKHEMAIAYNDKHLAIDWLIQKEYLQLSERDNNSTPFLNSDFPF